MAILLALELAGTAACTSVVQPCLNVAPYDDGEEKPGSKLDVGEETNVGPCLSPVEPVEPDEPPVTPCLEVALPDEPPMTPCLMVVRPPDPPNDEKDEPRVGPCLRVAPPRDDADDRDMPKPIPAPQEGEGMTARADVLEKLADSLPPDVLAKLRQRKE